MDATATAGLPLLNTLADACAANPGDTASLSALADALKEAPPDAAVTWLYGLFAAVRQLRQRPPAVFGPTGRMEVRQFAWQAEISTPDLRSSSMNHLGYRLAELRERASRTLRDEAPPGRWWLWRLDESSRQESWRRCLELQLEMRLAEVPEVPLTGGPFTHG